MGFNQRLQLGLGYFVKFGKCPKGGTGTPKAEHEGLRNILSQAETGDQDAR